MDELIEYWRGYRAMETPNGPVQVHADDIEALANHHLSYRRQKAGGFAVPKRRDNAYFGKPGNDFVLDLIPTPYAGDLLNAKVVLLMLNPGFHVGDRLAEKPGTQFRDHLERTLLQQDLDPDFPLMALNPAFANTPAYGWWEQKFSGLANTIMERSGENPSYFETLSRLSKAVAVIELFPYHSVGFRCSAQLVSSLQSAIKARQAVENLLAEGSRHVVATRAQKHWGLLGRQADFLCNYETKHARSASIGPRSKGGEIILRAMGYGD